MEQGVIRTVKAPCNGNCLQQLFNAMDEEEDFQLNVYWSHFSIASCLTVIRTALHDMKNEALNACLKKLCPECVHDYKGFSVDDIHHCAVDKSVKLVQLIWG